MKFILHLVTNLMCEGFLLKSRRPLAKCGLMNRYINCVSMNYLGNFRYFNRILIFAETESCVQWSVLFLEKHRSSSHPRFCSRFLASFTLYQRYLWCKLKLFANSTSIFSVVHDPVELMTPWIKDPSIIRDSVENVISTWSIQTSKGNYIINHIRDLKPRHIFLNTVNHPWTCNFEIGSTVYFFLTLP